MRLIKGTIGCLATIASAFVSLLALGIVIYTSFYISNVDVGVEFSTTPVNVTQTGCLLGDNESFSSSNCLLLQILGGITIGIGLVIGILQCCTCNFCGLGGILDLLFAVAGAAAWGAAAGIVMDAASNANDLDAATGNPEADRNEERRLIITILCWVEFGLFAVIVLNFLLKCCCCGGGRGGGCCSGGGSRGKASVNNLPKSSGDRHTVVYVQQPQAMAPAYY